MLLRKKPVLKIHLADWVNEPVELIYSSEFMFSGETVLKIYLAGDIDLPKYIYIRMGLCFSEQPALQLNLVEESHFGGGWGYLFV